MSATKVIFRRDGFSTVITPTAAIACDTVVITGGIVGVAIKNLTANIEDEIQIEGVYDVPVAAATAVGDEIKVTASTLAGVDSANVYFGVALTATTGAGTVKAKLIPYLNKLRSLITAEIAAGS